MRAWGDWPALFLAKSTGEKRLGQVSWLSAVPGVSRSRTDVAAARLETLRVPFPTALRFRASAASGSVTSQSRVPITRDQDRTGRNQRRPITVAGPRPNFTAFPFVSRFGSGRHQSRSIVASQCMSRAGGCQRERHPLAGAREASASLAAASIPSRNRGRHWQSSGQA